MELWTAFLVGLAGSAHCAGMCGPLALALPAAQRGQRGFLAGRLIYQAGRLCAYAFVGLVFGWLGKTVALAGFQRWLSIIAGLVLIAAFLANRLTTYRLGAIDPGAWVRSWFGWWLRQRNGAALFVLGSLNGLLPCGLVYVAGAAAAAAGEVGHAVAYMIVFGLGTVPMMLSLALAGRMIPTATRLQLQRLVPYCIVILAGLLILRGLSLGIPYLSPNLSAPGNVGASCH